jgi:hypothetical protein
MRELLLVFAKFDHNIVFCDKLQFFAENWLKSPKLVIITSTPHRLKKVTQRMALF